MLLILPEDEWRSIALNLAAPDILNFLSVHRLINDGLGKSPAFWRDLLLRDSDDAEQNNVDGFYCDAIREQYMVKAYMNHLPCVKWYSVRRSIGSRISAREGHLICVVPGPEKEQRIVITGGFTDDDHIHVLHVPPKQPHSSDDAAPVWTWSHLIPPTRHRTSFVYGASLTALPNHVSRNGDHVAQAVRFGGFESGGYSNETNEVWLLTLRTERNNENGVRLMASWEMVPTYHSHLATPRAYHTATLVAGRFLVIIGGMMWRESILSEAILDTHTWMWIDHPISTAGNDGKPSGRHGHSVVLDGQQNRLVLFGGGGGTDLLRSGSDNTEVWELRMNDDWKTSLQLPWTWSKIHCGDDGDELSGEIEMARDDEDDIADEENYRANHPLSPAESLCLGRCHHGLKVSQNTALLLFGSGRPSTNGMIGFDLRKNIFLRPKVIGTFPKPRFTGVAAVLEAGGYAFFHGGYSTQDSNAIDDMDVLDLAPLLNRKFEALPLETNRRPYRRITDQEVERSWYGINRVGGEQLIERIIALAEGGMLQGNDLEEFISSNAVMMGRNYYNVMRGESPGPENSDSDIDDSSGGEG